MKNILGTIALICGVAGSISYLPQVVHLVKIKDSRSISILTWTLWFVTQLPIIAYLTYIRDWFLIGIQSTNTAFVLIVLILSIIYRPKKELSNL